MKKRDLEAKLLRHLRRIAAERDEIAALLDRYIEVLDVIDQERLDSLIEELNEHM